MNSPANLMLKVAFITDKNDNANALKLLTDFGESPFNLNIIPIQNILRTPDFIILDDKLLHQNTKIILLSTTLPYKNVIFCPSYENFKLREFF